MSLLNSPTAARASMVRRMSLPTRDGLPESTSPPCMVPQRFGCVGELAIPENSTSLSVFVHSTPAGLDHAGFRFVGDVLRANAVATLSVSLHTAEEAAHRAPPAATRELVRRLQSVLAQLGEHAPTRGLRLALVGVNEAAALCALAARQPGFDALGSLILLDGRLNLLDAEVAAWRQPTLCIAGRHARPLSGWPLAGMRRLPPPHRLVKLPMQTQPFASAGAYEAMACELVAWFRQKAVAPRESALPAFTTIASAQRPDASARPF